MSMPRHKDNPILIARARAVSKTAQTLELWRKEAGAKSRWSSHQRLKEQALFNAAEAACNELTEAFLPRLPHHWNLTDWTFKPLRMGNELRWSPKNNKRYSTEIGNGTHQILTTVGFILGLAEAKDDPGSGHIRRQEELGMPPSDLHEFHIPRPRLPLTGYTIHDAYAAHAAKSFSRHYLENAIHYAPEELLERAWSQGARERASPPKWSAFPTLGARLAKNPCAKKILDRNADFAPFEPFDLFDRHVAAAIDLYKNAAPRTKTPQPFMILGPGDFGNGALGWCGRSAVATRILNLLRAQKMPSNVDEWKAYAIADECGKDARETAEAYRLGGAEVAA